MTESEWMPKLYKELGGPEFLEKASETMYQRVLQDDTLVHFFDGIDMDRQAQKLQAFLSFAIGGPHRYSPLDLVTSHADLVLDGLSNEHIDAWFDHLRATLDELNVSQAHTDQVITQVERFRNHVLGV